MQSLTTFGTPPFSPFRPINSSNGTPKILDWLGTGRVILASYLRFSLCIEVRRVIVTTIEVDAPIYGRWNVDLRDRDMARQVGKCFNIDNLAEKFRTECRQDGNEFS